MTMKTPEQIAREMTADYAGQRDDVVLSRHYFAEALREAIEADRAQRDPKPELLAIISQLNDNATDNPEYLRGQVEMAMDIVGYECGEDEALRAEFTQAAIRN